MCRVGISLVRLALISHLETYRDPVERCSGRIALALKSCRFRRAASPSGCTGEQDRSSRSFTTRNASASRPSPASAISPAGSASTRIPSPGRGGWTPRSGHLLRAASGLDAGGTPHFRAPVDVRAGGGCAHRQLPAAPPAIGTTPDPVGRRPRRRPRAHRGVVPRGRADRTGARPRRSVRSPSSRRLTIDTIATFLASSPVGSNVVRAIDRAMRLSSRRCRVQPAGATAHRQPAGPPVPQRVVDAGGPSRHVARSPPPAIDGEAMGDRTGHGRRPRGSAPTPGPGQVERRYALWVTAEFTPNGRRRRVGRACTPRGRRSARYFVADLDHARSWLRGDPVDRDARRHVLLPARFRLDRSERARAAAARASGAGRRRCRESWSAAGSVRLRRAEARGATIELITEALLAPCTIRHRTAVDTLKACSPVLKDEASATVASMLASVTTGTDQLEPDVVAFAERCTHLLGALAAAPAVEVDHLAPQATAAAVVIGQGCDPHRRRAVRRSRRGGPRSDCVGVRTGRDATGATRASPLLSTPASKPVSILATSSAPELAATGGPGTAAMFDWAATTLSDPLLGRRLPLTRALPPSSA